VSLFCSLSENLYVLKLIARQAVFGVAELVAFPLAIEFDTSAHGARISQDPLHSVILYVTSPYVFRAMSHLSDGVDFAVAKRVKLVLTFVRVLH
jgi:hypothetical protein